MKDARWRQKSDVINEKKKIISFNPNANDVQEIILHNKIQCENDGFIP